MMSKVKKNDGSFGSTHRRVSMLILMYVASRPHTSEDDATELISLIKETTKVHTEEIPLPSRYVQKVNILNLKVNIFTINSKSF